MGLLDYADTARKKLAGLLGDMPLVQMAQGRAEMPTMAGVLGALKSIPVFSPDAGQSAYEAAINIGPMGLGKIVYHGSPHKFDKFDFAGNIGRGEGAQAYGHGGYLADAKSVGQTYADMGVAPIIIGEEKIVPKLGQENRHDPLYAAWNEVTAAADGGHENPFKTAKERLGGKWGPSGKREAEALKIIEDWQRRGATVGERGYLYKADLPDEWIPKMLDWDKPLSEQSKEVQAAVKKARELAGKNNDYWQPGRIVGGKHDYGMLGDKVKAAEFLREAGIPGIRYLDGGSRGKGHGSYNYVVFPGLEDQVKILERNGIPLSGLLGGQ